MSNEQCTWLWLSGHVTAATQTCCPHSSKTGPPIFMGPGPLESPCFKLQNEPSKCQEKLPGELCILLNGPVKSECWLEARIEGGVRELENFFAGLVLSDFCALHAPRTRIKKNHGVFDFNSEILQDR